MTDTDVVALVTAIILKDRRDGFTEAQIKKGVEDAWKIVQAAHNKVLENTPL